MANSRRFEIVVEVVSDEEDLKVQKSFNVATQQYTYTPIIQREELDTNGEDSVSLNYSIADIADISTKNSSYSKTISLPATDRNRRVFALCAELGVDNGFNSKRLTRCYVLVETQIVFEGFLQLQNFNVTAGQNGVFEVNITSSAVTFFDTLGESKLQDLDWAYLRTVWNQDKIRETWDKDKANELFYPLMDPGMNIASFDYPNGNLNNYQHPQSYIKLVTSVPTIPGSTFVENFYPGIYLRSYLDRMFAYAGYSYKSEFFNSEMFSKIFIPYCGPKSMSMNDVNTPGNATLAYDRVFKVGRTSNILLTKNSTSYVSGAEEFIMKFNDRLNAPYSDPAGMYDTTNNWYKNSSAETVKMRFNVGCKFYANNGLFDKNTPGGDFQYLDKIQISVYRELPYDWSASSPGQWLSGYGFGVKTWTIYDANTSSSDEITEPLWNIQSGNFGFEVNLTTDWLDNPSWVYSLGKGTIGQQVDPGLSGRLFTKRAAIQQNERVRVVLSVLHRKTGTQVYQGMNSYFYNDVSTDVVYNGRVDIDRIVPQNIRCQDFMKSLINMFNLHIEASKDDERKLIIEPREQFFKSGKTIDWSDKVDLSQPIKFTILANTQPRRNKFELKTDKDALNTNYQTIFGEPYGTYTYDTGSQFNTSTNTIESLFAASPLVKYNDNVYWVNNTEKWDGPTYPVFPESEFKATTPRLLFANKNKNSINGSTCIKFMFEQIGYKSGGSYTGYYYPYAGPIDDVNFPSFDLNFAQPKAMYYNLTSGINVTQQNLFNSYWKTQMDELSHKDARLVSLYLNLDANDIASFTFANQVYIQVSHPMLGTSSGSYFKVNAIKDYNPSVNQSTLVELLKTERI